jgi:hypothetical protein
VIANQIAPAYALSGFGVAAFARSRRTIVLACQAEAREASETWLAKP